MHPLEWIAARPYLEMALVAIGLILDGCLGGWISTKVRNQQYGVWFTFLSGNISLLIWAYLSKWSQMSLPKASVFFDVVYNASWFLMLIYLGARMTPIQMFGIALVTLGIALLGYNPTPAP